MCPEIHLQVKKRENLDPTSQKTYYVSITKIKSTRFQEIIAVYYQLHTKHVD